MFWTLIVAFLGCNSASVDNTDAEVAAVAEDCTQAKNACPDYAPSWVDSCPEGERCITFKNSCEKPVALAYQIGCNGDGTKGAPQCDCTDGKTLAKGEQVFWQIVDGDYTSCLPSWQPACLTAGLAVLANFETSSCTTGSRIEFSAGNKANDYGRFDSYNLDIEKEWYQVPLSFEPELECAKDHANHDCRPLYCNSDTCPDAYATPTEGGCADGRSPQAGCQDTFMSSKGFVVEFCPSDCATTGGDCPSCQDAKACALEASEDKAKAPEAKAKAKPEPELESKAKAKSAK